MRHNGDRRPEDIEAEIARTRSDLDQTLTAIEHRLTPGQLIDQGLHYLRQSGGREFAANLSTSVQRNPLPVTLVGIGLGWLMLAGNSSGRPSSGSGHMRERAGEAADRISEASSAARQSLGESARAARERISSTTSSMREQMSHMSETVRQQAERARGGFDYMLREQPLALGAIGLALGAVLAAAMPRTRKEDELMGEARDRLAEQAKEAGREQLDKAQQVASAAAGAATREAERQGMKEPSAETRPPSGPKAAM
jgi:ElaB/YqjD/DUF883 family membrane-anchored ribosome-binding protein